MRRFLAAVGVLACLGAASPLAAQAPTRVRVRVVSHDAKVIGSGVGGARVTVRDPATGTVLFEGLQEGGTGDTRAIVVDPVTRGDTVYDTPGTAHVTVELPLEVPTVLEFIGEGPLGYGQAVQRASKTMLIVPGQDVLGDGVLLALHGFIVELVEPAILSVGSDSVEVRVRVRMLCGCPLEPGGLWDADRLEVRAQLSVDGEVLDEAPLRYAGVPNMFQGTVALDGVPAGATLVAIASDPARANFGRSETLSVP